MKNVGKSKKHSKIILIAAVLAVAAVLLLSVAGVFQIREVTVTGNEYYTREEIVDLVLQDARSHNALYLYLHFTYREHPDIPFVDTYEVKFNSPSSMTIRVYEKGVVGYVRYLGKNVYFDKDGIVVESSGELLEGIPMIRGLTFDQLTMYQPLNVSDPEIFGKILDITQLLTKYELHPDEIRFGGDEELYLQMKEVKVALGKGDHLDEKVARLKQLEADLLDKSGTLHMESYTDESTHISLESSRS
ncbi:MAG: cell division protein FtsQ [Lachnospiraceae bacterium]|nr:cell division protein FtsQ [Lachnospiraceae bacterium]